MVEKLRRFDPLDDPDFGSTRLWPDDQIKGKLDNPEAYGFESSRIGGEYTITRKASIKLRNFTSRELGDDDDKKNRLYARLRTELINRHYAGNPRPLVDESLIDVVCNANMDLTVPEGMARLLRYLVGIADNDEIVDLAVGSNLRSTAMGWSESANDKALDYLINGLLKAKHEETVAYGGEVRITVEGHKAATEASHSPRKTAAFVAMWFNEATDKVGTRIENAIDLARYEPIRIDKETIEGLIDEAIEEKIEDSEFIVADLTHGTDGARGSVYYEAGLARGRGKVVILTAKEDHLGSKIHFDLDHYQILTWTEDELENFEKSLYGRIKDLVGEGKYVR